MDTIKKWEAMSRRFSIIPLDGKKPVENNWQQWCLKRRPFNVSDFAFHNAGIACGPASKSIVLDIDHTDFFKKIQLEKGWETPTTLTIKTGSGRYHLYYEYPVSRQFTYGCTSFKDPHKRVNPDTGKIWTIFDVRGIGGQVVAPYSIHPDTNQRYSVARDIPMVAAPTWLLSFVETQKTKQKSQDCGFTKWEGRVDDLPLSREVKDLILSGANKGNRSEAIMSVCNALVYCRLTDDEIHSIFDQYAIGDKYREKGRTRQKWLNKHIHKARLFVTDEFDPDKSDFIYQVKSDSHGRDSGVADICTHEVADICTPYQDTKDLTCEYNILYIKNSKDHANEIPSPNVEIIDKNHVSKCQQVSANVSNVSAKCQQLLSENCNHAESQEKLEKDVFGQFSKLGVAKDYLTDISQLYANTCEREFDPDRLENICRHLADILLTSADNCRHLLTSGNLTQDIRNWLYTCPGIFHITDVYRDLNITNRSVKLSVQKALERLRDAGVVERHGEKKGNYRLVDSECPEIDWRTASVDHMNIRWPFGIENLVKTMHGNIVCVAGEPNSGKTAFLLNVVDLNMFGYEIHYFSSEMGPSEFKARLSGFEPDRGLCEWNVHFYERAGNFTDVIKPGKGVINIIDFLEVHEDFWKVGGLMKAIHDKLDGAIAVIAIQKNAGSDYGLGGTRGLEKPRLYLAMSPGKCKIVKGKNWATYENPNGLEVDYKLAGGCKFYTTGSWHRPESTETRKTKGWEVN